MLLQDRKTIGRLNTPNKINFSIRISVVVTLNIQNFQLITTHLALTFSPAVEILPFAIKNDILLLKTFSEL